MGLPRRTRKVGLMHDRKVKYRKVHEVPRESSSVRQMIKRTVNRRNRQAWRQSRVER